MTLKTWSVRRSIDGNFHLYKMESADGIYGYQPKAQVKSWEALYAAKSLLEVPLFDCEYNDDWEDERDPETGLVNG